MFPMNPQTEGEASLRFSSSDAEISAGAAKGVFMRKYLWALGVGLLAGGLYRGEARQVLSKAVRICLECIGIG